MYGNHKQKIFELKARGYSYGQIKAELGCSKGTIAFHLGVGQREKYRLRRIKFRKNSHPYLAKLQHFSEAAIIKNKAIGKSKYKALVRSKIKNFCGGRKMSNGKYGVSTFTINDVIDKFGENPKCYLTGDDIDITKSRTYHFDHIIPKSRGGLNTIDNLGICTKDSNQSKNDMTKDEYIEQCKKVLLHNGYEVTKK